MFNFINAWLPAARLCSAILRHFTFPDVWSLTIKRARRPLPRRDEMLMYASQRCSSRSIATAASIHATTKARAKNIFVVYHLPGLKDIKAGRTRCGVVELGTWIKELKMTKMVATELGPGPAGPKPNHARSGERANVNVEGTSRRIAKIT